MDIVVSDLDGTLLDHETYSFESALPGIALLRSKFIPLILCTSKTRSEVEYWRSRIGNDDPFVVENGGAIYIPESCFDFTIPEAGRSGPYLVLQLGAGYADLLNVLREASKKAQCKIRGFHEMTVSEVSRVCGLTTEMAELAKDREFDEPFLILDSGKEDALAAAIEAGGKHCVRGGRFYHITGENDKAAAVERVLALYRRRDPGARAIGLGDGLNDAPFLNIVDVPILIRTPWLDKLQAAAPKGSPTSSPGPLGWNEAITALFSWDLPSG